MFLQRYNELLIKPKLARKFGPKVPPTDLWQWGAVVSEPDPVGDSSFPLAGVPEAFPPSLSARGSGSGTGAQAWLRAAPEPRGIGTATAPWARSWRRPLFSAVQRCGHLPRKAEVRGRVPPSGDATLTRLYAARDPESAGLREPRSGPTPKLPGLKKPSMASSLTARALRWQCWTSPFPPSPPPPPR